MTSPVVSNAKYVILGASGNTGSIIANFLLSKGQKVCVVGRDAGRLQRFVDKGAKAFTADMSEATALISAVNASAPLSTKRCSRPGSRPMTRTF